MADDRSLRDLLFESVDDLESIVKHLIDSLLNRDKQLTVNKVSSKVADNKKPVTDLVLLFDEKQEEIRKLLAKVPEFQAREQLIRELSTCVEERDKTIQTVEFCLKATEVALNSIVYKANQKLKVVKESEMRPVNSEDVVKLAHQISRNYSVTAPLYWQQGDPSRPFPQEHEFRSGWLLNPKAAQSGGPSQHGLGIRQPSSQAGTPSAAGRVAGSPMVGGQQQKVWSPRSGTSTTPNRMQAVSGQPPWVSAAAQAQSSPFMKKPLQSPLVSPSLNISISGVPTRMAPPPVRNVEQMSSDSSSSSSSEDEAPTARRR